MHTVIMETAINITLLRKKRHWTQGDMADHFGVDKSTVWRWENEGIPARGVSRKAIEREWKEAMSEQAREAAQ